MLRPQQTGAARHQTVRGRFAKIAKSAQGTSDGSGNLVIIFKDDPPPTQIWTGTVFVDQAPASMSTKAIVGVVTPGLTAATAVNAGVPWGTALGGGALQVQVDGADSASLILVSTTAPPATTFTAWFIGSSTDSDVAAEVGYSFPFPAPPTSGAPPPFTAIGALGTLNAGANLVLAAPSGTLNLLIAVFISTTNSFTSTPTGWVLISSVTNGSTLQVWAKKTGPSEPATYTWSFTSATTSGIGRILNYGSGGPAGGAVTASPGGVANLQAPAAPIFGVGDVIEIWADVTSSGPLTITTQVNTTLTVRSNDSVPATNEALLIADFPTQAGTVSMTGDTAGDGSAIHVKLAITLMVLPTGS